MLKALKGELKLKVQGRGFENNVFNRSTLRQVKHLKTNEVAKCKRI